MNARVVIDLGFGDAGKGSMVDYFTRRDHSDLTVRFNGGGQAAHTVVTDRTHHTFRQFGSGTLAGGVRTLYARDALLDPQLLLHEANDLCGKGVQNPHALFFVEEEAVITTVYQQAMNRIRETLRGAGRRGSCGLGIGETTKDRDEHPELVLRVADLRTRNLALQKLEAIRAYKLEAAREAVRESQHLPHQDDLELLESTECSAIVEDLYRSAFERVNVVTHDQAIDMLRGASSPVFEGAQGILLDQDVGFYPYITRTDTTHTGARMYARDAGLTLTTTGIVRAYCVRHGAGPMPTESEHLSRSLVEPHNQAGQWQGSFRVGHFDAVMTRYALGALGGVDDIVITCLDRIQAQRTSACTEYAIKNKKIRTIEMLRKSVAGKAAKRVQSESLFHATPQLLPLSSFEGGRRSAERYCLELAESLGGGVRIGGASNGPRAADKIVFS